MDEMYAVYGASGFGREVMHLARKQLLLKGGTIEQLVFVDDNPQSYFVNGHKVMQYVDFVSLKVKKRYLNVAIAESSIRKKLTERMLIDNIELWEIRDNNVVEMDEVEIGEGAILSSFVTITSNVRIGKCFHGNLYSYVAHDCQIGDYVTFAPNVMCNGNVIVEDQVYIATGAIIRQGKPASPIVIGEGAIVGMGAVVTKSVPPGITVIGNPAAPLSKKNLRRNM